MYTFIKSPRLPFWMSLFLMGVFTFLSQYSAAVDEEPLNIQEVQTNLGVTAWLVESHSLPMVSVEVAFKAGAAYDPRGKRGVAGLMAGLLSEGAGGFNSQNFQEQVEGLGMRLHTGTGLLGVNIGMDALPEVIDDAFHLFSLAIQEPEFTEKDFTRLKDAALAVRGRVEESPKRLALEAFANLVYGRHHAYASPVPGTEATLKNITLKDVRRQHKKMFTRRNMVISVVGAITPQRLKALLEKHFKNLPQGKALPVIQAPTMQPAAVYKKVKDIPQTTIVMGHKGLNREDEDYFAALFANHILGGGGFTSLLMEEVREKRGLVYSIHSAFEPLPFWGSFRIVAQTKNETAQQVVNIVHEEIKKLQKEGVPQQRYEDALSYLVGSFPLRLDSNADILNYLTFMQTEGLPKDYMNNWTDRIRAVTLKDVHQVFKKRLMPENMAIVMVGNPDNVTFEKAKQETLKKEEVAKKIAMQAHVLQPVQANVKKAPVAQATKTGKQSGTLSPFEEERIEEKLGEEGQIEERQIEEEQIAAPIAQFVSAPDSAPISEGANIEKPHKPNDYRELKDGTTTPRKRRNVGAKKWL